MLTVLEILTHHWRLVLFNATYNFVKSTTQAPKLKLNQRVNPPQTELTEAGEFWVVNSCDLLLTLPNSFSHSLPPSALVTLSLTLSHAKLRISQACHLVCCCCHHLHHKPKTPDTIHISSLQQLDKTGYKKQIVFLDDVFQCVKGSSLHKGQSPFFVTIIKEMWINCLVSFSVSSFCCCLFT